jgi:hypothetical protein
LHGETMEKPGGIGKREALERGLSQAAAATNANPRWKFSNHSPHWNRLRVGTTRAPKPDASRCAYKSNAKL